MTQGLEAQLAEYLRLYRNSGILLDSNVLLLLWLAEFDQSLVGGKRLEKYSVDDVTLLKSYVGKFSLILTTQTILTETSNLASKVLSGRRKAELFERLYPLFNPCAPSQFQQCSIEQLSLSQEVFVSLGYTDATLVALANSSEGRLLLTDDLDLYVAAITRQAPAINFTHMREAAGLFE